MAAKKKARRKKPKRKSIRFDLAGFRPHNGHPDYRIRVQSKDGTVQKLGGQMLSLALIELYRFVVLCWARRVGKTSFYEWLSLDKQSKKPGMYYSAYIAPDHPKAKEKMDVFIKAMGGDPNKDPSLKGKTRVLNVHPSEGQDRWVDVGPLGQEGHEENEEARYYFFSGTPPYYEKIQGFQHGWDVIFITEAQLQVQRMVFQTIMPMMADNPECKLILEGHPDHQAQGNDWFEIAFEQGKDPEWRKDGWISARFPIEANPFMWNQGCTQCKSEEPCDCKNRKEGPVNTNNIQQLRRATRNQPNGDVMEKEEYDAIFTRSAGAVFPKLDKILTLPFTTDHPLHDELTTKLIETAGVTIPRMVSYIHKPPIKGHSYVMAGDWAKMRDAFACPVFDQTDNTQAALFHCRAEGAEFLEEMMYWAILVKEIYGAGVIHSDANGIGAHITEKLQRRYHTGCVPHNWQSKGASSKGLYVGRGVTLFANEEVRLIDCPVQRKEFKTFRKDKTDKGNITYSHPEGGNDDTVASFCYLAGDLQLGTRKPLEEKPLPPEQTPGTFAWQRRQSRRQERPIVGSWARRIVGP